jgi:penicillin-binding protein 2
MADQEQPLFPLREQGIGLQVDLENRQSIAHEILFEERYQHAQDQPVFLGAALPRKRYWLVLIAVLGLAGALLGRAFWMQVVAPEIYQVRAEDNRLRHEVIPSRRGVVRDREGKMLVENVPAFDLRVIPWLMPRDPEERDGLLAVAGRSVGLTLDEMLSEMASSSNPAESLTLKRDIPYDQALAIKIAVGDNPALHIATGNKRRYPDATAFQSLSHILGYVGPISVAELKDEQAQGYRQTDVIGKTGIEYTYESLLRGEAGERVYEVDAQNRVTALVSEQAPVDGSDLVLTLDLEFQKQVEEILRLGMEKFDIKRGSAVVMDPRDGSLLAIASWPAYDANLFSGSVSSTYYASLLANEDRPLLARAWSGVYPAGSTVKPVVAVAALMEKIVSANTSFNSVGGIRIGQTFFPDWKAGGHGSTNVRRAIAWSVNTFFYYVGGGYESFVGLGVDRLTKWMRIFGLGSEAGLDLPGENSGFVPSKEWKEKTKGERWFVGDTYNLSIGQGDLLVTPLQVAAFTAAVANGGYMVRPHVGNVSATAFERGERLADEYVINLIRQGMRDTVVYGSGTPLRSLPFEAAGKTGTAQWRRDRLNHAWFTSFAPYESPEIVVTVLLEEGDEGSRTALPVATQILMAWYRQKSGLPLATQSVEAVTSTEMSP